MIFPRKRRGEALALFHFVSNLGDLPMTQTQFAHECAKRTIDPQLALENDELCDALRERDDESVIRILNEQF